MISIKVYLDCIECKGKGFIHYETKNTEGLLTEKTVEMCLNCEGKGNHPKIMPLKLIINEFKKELRNSYR